MSPSVSGNLNYLDLAARAIINVLGFCAWVSH